MHGVAAENEGGREQDAYKCGLAQEVEPIPLEHLTLLTDCTLAMCQFRRKTRRQCRCHETGASEPKNGREPESAHRLSSNEDSGNEGSGACPSHPAIFERSRVVACGRARPGERERIGQG